MSKLYIKIDRPSEDQIDILRTIAMAPVTSVAVMDVKHPEGFAILQAYGLVESNEHAVWCSPLGRLVLAACDADAPDPVGKVVEVAALSGSPTAEVERLKQRVGELEGLLRELDDAGVQAIYGEGIGADDAVRDLMTYRAISDKVRHALSPDTPERGEGGAG